MSIDNIRDWSYSFAIPVWCVYETTGFHLGNIGLTDRNSLIASGDYSPKAPIQMLSKNTDYRTPSPHQLIQSMAELDARKLPRFKLPHDVDFVLRRTNSTTRRQPKIAF